MPRPRSDFMIARSHRLPQRTPVTRHCLGSAHVLPFDGRRGWLVEQTERDGTTRLRTFCRLRERATRP